MSLSPTRCTLQKGSLSIIESFMDKVQHHRAEGRNVRGRPRRNILAKEAKSPLSQEHKSDLGNPEAARVIRRVQRRSREEVDARVR